MNRNDFISGKEGEKNPDPKIMTNQIWKSLEAKDFQDGRGKIEFSIIIRFFNPITSKWVCAFHGGSVVNSFNTFEMTQKDIFKDFQFDSMWKPTLLPNQPLWVNPNMVPFNDGVPMVGDRTYFTNTTGPTVNTVGIGVSGTYLTFDRATMTQDQDRFMNDMFDFSAISTTAGQQPTAIAETKWEFGSFSIS